jgi:hypothetical protein
VHQKFKVRTNLKKENIRQTTENIAVALVRLFQTVKERKVKEYATK